MSDLRQAAQQALEAMLNFPDDISDEMFESIRALRAALAQEQAEPVQEPAFHGFMSADGTRIDLCFTPSAPRSDGTYATAYYTTPPLRPRLTDEEIAEAVREADLDWQAGWTLDEHEPNRFTTLTRAVERKVRGEAE